LAEIQGELEWHPFLIALDCKLHIYPFLTHDGREHKTKFLGLYFHFLY